MNAAPLFVPHHEGRRPGCSKLPAWQVGDRGLEPQSGIQDSKKIGDRGFEPNSGLQVSKKLNVSSPLTRIDSILCGASVTVASSVSVCPVIHLTILGKFSWPSLAYNVHCA